MLIRVGSACTFLKCMTAKNTILAVSSKCDNDIVGKVFILFGLRFLLSF